MPKMTLLAALPNLRTNNLKGLGATLTNDLKPWRKDMWCIPQIDADYGARMEDAPDLDPQVPNPTRPLVWFDECPIQIIGEVRQPIPAARRARSCATIANIDVMGTASPLCRGIS